MTPPSGSNSSGTRRGGRRRTSMFRSSVSSGSGNNTQYFSCFGVVEEGIPPETTINNALMDQSSAPEARGGILPLRDNNGHPWSANSTETGSTIKEEEEQQTVVCSCPRGHIMELTTNSNRELVGTCDYCNADLDDDNMSGCDTDLMVCFRCGGFAICSKCIVEYSESEMARSANNYTAGMELFANGKYKEATTEFQTSLEMLQSIARKGRLEVHHCAFNAEMLAKAQYMAAEDDEDAVNTALHTCALAISYYWSRANGGPWQKHLRRVQQLAVDMHTFWRDQLQQQQKQQQKQPSYPSNSDGVDLELLGVSVHHLQTLFLAKVRVATNLGRHAKINQIENLQGPQGIIRQQGSNVICPMDGKKGAAYVHSIFGEDHVGKASYMLSYSWSYTIGDIVDALSDFCKTNGLDPKRTYVWICCLCINQHRVVEQKEKGGTGMLDFEQEFPAKLNRIGHMLAMMTPWQNPVYLTRVWCIFEIYVAHTVCQCPIDIIMSPKERISLENDVIEGGGGINMLYKALQNTKVQNAKSSVESDRQTILGIIESKIGYQEMNRQVNELLREWIKNVLFDLAKIRENSNTEQYATFCYKIGTLFKEGGHYDAALDQYQKSLSIKESVWGKGHPTTATIYNSIASVMNSIGDYDGALEQYGNCLSIEEAMLGKDHPDTAIIFHHMGAVWRSKGNYDAALEYHEKGLAIQGDMLMMDAGNPLVQAETATTYSSIGSALQVKGDYKGAMIHFQKGLSIAETLLGKDHPSAATIHSNIGSLTSETGDYDDALDHYNKCLSIQEGVLGNGHPDTAGTRRDIGLVLREKGDYTGAMELQRRSLGSFQSAFGEEHPATKSCINEIEWLEEAQRVRDQVSTN